MTNKWSCILFDLEGTIGDSASGITASLGIMFEELGRPVPAPAELLKYVGPPVLDAVNADAGLELTELKVDGGMTANALLVQFQSDLLDVPVVRPKVSETTALGAAYVAGLAVGYWSGLDELRRKWSEDRRWMPLLDPEERERLLRNWRKAVTKSFDWVDEGAP